MMLSIEQFDPYFRALWNRPPFPWQRRLARQLCETGWPEVIALPTASGKTACLDIVVFALALQAERAPDQRTIGRRVFFVVNRRVIVDEAYARAVRVACLLAAARAESPPESVLRQVADALVRLAGGPESGSPPLDAAILRGGIYRDSRWMRSITQPTVIVSTVDQVGSRLLFRGYGVRDAARPIHAALIAHDSTILLDEAHISVPFAQTLDAVRQYRGADWATEPIRTPFAVVSMTATPRNAAGTVFRMDASDRTDEVFERRYAARKPVSLIVAPRAGPKNGESVVRDLASALAQQAQSLAANGRQTVAIFTNRVATARAVYSLLRSRAADGRSGIPAAVHLAIGRMRPIDRDALTQLIQRRVQGGVGPSEGPPMFVVATQCLEVGADFDFDAVVSECASLDALRQRFGRLNRTGRAIPALGCVVIHADQKRAADDPIYGTALAETWKWLQQVATAGSVDFGADAMDTKLEGNNRPPPPGPQIDAPVMFPAYLDAWAQTYPAPAPDPDVALFLHGPRRGEPDVNVCWRSDIPDSASPEVWTDIVGLCPPSAPECMPVPIGVVRAWLARRGASDDQRGDLLGARTPDEDAPDSTGGHTAVRPSRGEVADGLRPALAWRGPSASVPVKTPDNVHPGDTIVLRVADGGWSVLGHIPDAPLDPAIAKGREQCAARDLASLDVAERAYRQSHGQAIVRLTDSRLEQWPCGDARTALAAWLSDEEADLREGELRSLLLQASEAMPPDQAPTAETLRVLANRTYGLSVQRYPAPLGGVVLATRRRVPPVASPVLPAMPAMDDGDDETSRTVARAPVSLVDHTRHVREALERTLHVVPGAAFAVPLRVAADRHDWGKADERFQALLVNGSREDAWAQPMLWAKSASIPRTATQRCVARSRSGLPAGFRHEMLSLQLSEHLSSNGFTDPAEADLVLHLIAAHHGYARPFAPAVHDLDPSDITLDMPDATVCLTTEQRTNRPAHRLDSGVAERFWRLTRRFGWWGLAYLEAVLRLSDQSASAREDERPDQPLIDEPAEAAKQARAPQ